MNNDKAELNSLDLCQPRGPLSSAERIGVLENRFSLSLTAHIALNLDAALRAALTRAEKAEAERDGTREALEFYANRENHASKTVTQSCGCCSDIIPPAVETDYGERAREAISRLAKAMGCES